MQITYEEFLKYCFKADNVSIVEAGERYPVDKNYSKYIDKDLFLEVDWVSGGEYGNSCYGKNSKSVPSENPKDIETPLAEIFDALDYDISFVTYNKKIRPLIENFERNSKADFYGNYYVYSGLRIKLKDIYDIINELN